MSNFSVYFNTCKKPILLAIVGLIGIITFSLLSEWQRVWKNDAEQRDETYTTLFWVFVALAGLSGCILIYSFLYMNFFKSGENCKRAWVAWRRPRN